MSFVMVKKVYVYIDGFNLFYGALKQRPQYRWLNPELLVRHYIHPNYFIDSIKFYTARISARDKNDQSPKRQQIYFNALKTIKNLKIILGNFQQHEVSLPKSPISNPIKYQKVIKTEEKGSDVNLASHLVYDGCLDNYELAIVISNDTDLLEPIRIVKRELKKDVMLICPHKHIAKSFNSLGIQLRKISASKLKQSLFDNQINSKIKCPNEWK
jgi:uncharacterized LabA/DUF88 family protein